MNHRQRAPGAENRPCSEPRLRQGLVTVFTGDGRGKTSAAIGSAVRAAGHGLHVLVVFFMKGPDFVHGEVLALKKLPNITLRSFGERGWARPGQDNAKHRRQAEEALDFSRQEMASGAYDLVVLDEAVSAVKFGLLTSEDITGLLDIKPDHVELILTGRDASAALVNRADTVTEMRCLKHPFEKGIPARAGIDY